MAIDASGVDQLEGQIKIDATPRLAFLQVARLVGKVRLTAPAHKLVALLMFLEKAAAR